MPSSFKENIRSSTPSVTSPTKMNDGDVFGLSAPEIMLSPPPEEELRYTRRTTHEPGSVTRPLMDSMRSNQQSPVALQAAKRKRTIADSGTRDSSNVLQDSANGTQHTPNPRVRKQVRHAVASPDQTRTIYTEAPLGSPSRGGCQSRTLVQEDGPMTPTRKGKSRGRSLELVSQSPHATNPNADYIPPSRLVMSPRGVSVRRRSATPIPPYEPPKERYTPPREVVISPSAAEHKSTRRTTTKKRVTVKTEKAAVPLRIKTEPPEVDLTSPAPPASPGDDPILLVGPPTIKVQRPSLSPSDSREVSLVNFEMELDLPEKRRQASSSVNQQAMETPARSSSIPPAFDFSTLNDDDSGMVSNGFADSSSEVDFGQIIDDGNFANVNDDEWSDSDDDNGNNAGTSIGEGDFTGKFLAFQAPVKLDPPADDDDRMEKWARPISPHPKRLSLVGPKEEDVDVSLDEVSGNATARSPNNASVNDKTDVDGSDSQAQEDCQANKRSSYEDRRGRRLTLSEVEAIKFGTSSSTPTPDPVIDVDDGHSRQDSVTGIGGVSLEQTDGLSGQGNNTLYSDESTHSDTDKQPTILDKTSTLDRNSQQYCNLTDGSYRLQNAQTEDHHDNHSARSASVHSSGESSQSTLNNPDAIGPEYRDHIENEEYKAHLLKYGKDTIQDETMDHATSLLREPCPPNGHLSECETEIAAEEDQEDDSDDGASDLSVVKVMSDDPLAAARAAAILKMHDYDMVARKLRRRKTTGSGISKAYSSPKNMQLWRRRTVAGLAAEDVLSANISLPDLLEKAEEELRSSPARSRSGSVALSAINIPQKSRWHDFMYENADVPGIREWTKADWKLLDSCFTDERYDLGEQMGLEAGCLAEVDDVPLESVVERFIEIMGSAGTVQSHGPSWTTDKLMSRVRALCKRQRAGNGAPPTPNLSARFSTPRFSTRSPTPSMIVPDFTPAVSERTWLFDSGSVSRKARLPPPSSESFFKVPSTLPARHSRLREDVTSEVLETPKPSRALDLFGFATPARNAPQPQHEDSDDESIAQEVDAMLTPITASRVRQSRPESAVKRSLNYITSWLKSDMYKSKNEKRKGLQLPGLPIPPEDVLSKPRGPVETPAPKAAEKPVPHKELVSLEHVPPPKPTRIPRLQKPRRLVDLNHVSTPDPKEESKKTISRRSSTSSVKDLIKEFEEKEKGKIQALPPRVAELRRQASVGSLKEKGKPTWRP